ncbi:hypothetical protein B0H14DRAFT_2974871 [Mycena olivaceomarginata]|nr:hypothetical protein B0H14DRAFT_2974871 [Mycena olivaceomarginata]
MLPPRAYTFIGLNGLRVLSIIGLILVFSSQIVTLVHDIQAVNNFQAGKAAAVSDSATNTTAEDILSNDYVIGSTVPNQPAGVFWAVLNRLLIIFQVIILLLSEFGWPSAFFNRALGIIECLLGAAILSHHVDEFSLVAAFFLFAIGLPQHARGPYLPRNALPTHVAGVDVRPIATAAPVEKPQEEPKIGNGFGRQGERAAGLKGFLISKPIESLPRYGSNRCPSAA